MGRGRAPCCEKIGLNKGTWTEEEDMKLIAYIKKYGHQNWRALPRLAGLLRCGKSCRLRWINYLRPDIKRGNFTKEEEETIIKLHTLLGNKWSKIASCLPGRTDNEIKNVWNTHLKKRVPSREQQPMANKTEEAPSTCTSSTSRSCSDQGEGKSKSEFSDRLVQLIEIPIDPSIDMFGILEDGLPTLMQKGEMEDKNMLGTYLEMVSPCSSSSVFLETNQNDAKQGDQMLNGVDQEENNYNLSISDVLSEPEIWKIFEDGDSHSLCQWLEPETHRVPMKMEGETDADGKSKEWLDYLEKELGLDGAAGEDDQKSIARDAVEELDPWDEMDGDPVSSYFQTGNFSLPPLQILPSGINCSNPKVRFD